MACLSQQAVYPTYIVHMHLTFLPIVLLAIIGLGYYTSMAIGTLIVFVGVMICFEIARRASLSDLCSVSRVKEEVNKLYPFNQTKDNGIRILFPLIFNALAVGMILMLLLWMWSRCNRTVMRHPLFPSKDSDRTLHSSNATERFFQLTCRRVCALLCQPVEPWQRQQAHSRFCQLLVWQHRVFFGVINCSGYFALASNNGTN